MRSLWRYVVSFGIIWVKEIQVLKHFYVALQKFTLDRSAFLCVVKNKLTPAFYARVLLLMMNFLITLSKYSQSGGSTDSATPRVHSQTILTNVLTKSIINKKGAPWKMALTVRFSSQKHSCRNIINFKLIWNVEV